MGQLNLHGIWLFAVLALQLFVKCSCQSQFISIIKPSGGCPSYDEESLRPDTSYIVSTTTITPGQSGPNPPVIETFVTETVPPNTLRAWDIQTDAFSIYWRPTSQDEPGPFTIQARDGSTTIEMDAADVSGLNSITFQDLMPGTIYEVVLFGGSQELATTAILTRPRPLSLLTLESASTNTLGLRWERSPDLIPEDAMSYYEVCFHAPDRNHEIRITSTNDLELSNLIAGSTYTVSITVIVNRNGLRGASSPVYRFFRTVSSTLPTTPRSLDITSLSTNSFRLSWDIPAGAFDAFEVEYSPQYGFPPSPIRVPPDQSSLQLDHLISATEYQFSLVTTEGRKLSKVRSPPVETSFRTADGSFDVQVYNIRDTSAEVIHGVEPTASSYSIHVINGNEVVDQSVQSADLPRIRRIYGLLPNTSYVLVVAALDDRGSSIGELMTTFSTLLTAAEPPTVTQSAATTASIALSVPDMEFEHSLVQVRFGGDGGFGAAIGSPIMVDKSPCPRVELNDLRPDELYEIDISHVVGDTGTEATVVGVNTRPLGPTDVGVNTVGTTTVELVWRGGTGDFENYQLVYLSDSSGGDVLFVPSTSTSYVLTNLRPGTVYRVTIAEVGGAPGLRMTEFATKPLDPTNLRFTNLQTQSFTVSWDSDDEMFEICHDSSGNIPSPYLASQKEVVLTGLEPDSVVQVAVRAVVQLNGVNYYSDEVIGTQRTREEHEDNEKNCQEIICPSFCGVNAHCEELEDCSLACRCNDGYSGAPPNCEGTPCPPVPLLICDAPNSYCSVDSQGTRFCTCLDGYQDTGIECVSTENECSPACGRNAYCVMNAGFVALAHCSCRNGFTRGDVCKPEVTTSDTVVMPSTRVITTEGAKMDAKTLSSLVMTTSTSPRVITTEGVTVHTETPPLLVIVILVVSGVALLSLLSIGLVCLRKQRSGREKSASQRDPRATEDQDNPAFDGPSREEEPKYFEASQDTNERSTDYEGITEHDTGDSDPNYINAARAKQFGFTASSGSSIGNGTPRPGDAEYTYVDPMDFE